MQPVGYYSLIWVKRAMTQNGLTPAKSLAPSGRIQGARIALTLLLLINLFNYIDRQVLAAVEPEIQAELLPEDPNAKGKMGILATAFLITYMLLAPVFGWLAERTSRWKLVAIGLIVWTLASGASGWNWHTSLPVAFFLLLVTRCFVGVGEAAYGPVAPAMISDFFPESRRGRVLSFFYLAIPVGGALGYALGDLVASSPLGWRWAFFLVVPPGIVLGIWSLLMRDSKRGLADQTPVRAATVKDYVTLLWIPSYVLNTLGMTAMTFAIGGLAFWVPKFFEVHETPDAVIPLAGVTVRARTFFGALTALSGLLATILGGLAGDALRPRFSGSYFLVSAVPLLIAFPAILGMIYLAHSQWVWLFVFAAVFCLFFNTGPTNAILANVTHPAIRASAFAINILIIHLFGDAISPAVIGAIADLKLRPTEAANLDLGFIVISLSALVGGVFWLWGARYLERDTTLATTRLGPST
jgi:MFS family permease